MGHRQQEQQQQQQFGANGFSSRYTSLQWLQTSLFDMWNVFPPTLALSPRPTPPVLPQFFSSSSSIIEDRPHHCSPVIVKATLLNIDICFLLVPDLLLAQMWPHMILRCWLDRPLTQKPPLIPASNCLPLPYGSTGVCTHCVIIIMEAVTANPSHIFETWCPIKLGRQGRACSLTCCFSYEEDKRYMSS